MSGLGGRKFCSVLLKRLLAPLPHRSPHLVKLKRAQITIFELYPWIRKKRTKTHFIISNWIYIYGMDPWDCRPEAMRCPLIDFLLVFCRGPHLLSVRHLFISLTLIRHRTIVPNSFSPLLTGLASAGRVSKKVLRVHRRAALSWLKVGRGLPKDYFSAF